MKRFLILLLAVLMIFSLSSCAKQRTQRAERYIKNNLTSHSIASDKTAVTYAWDSILTIVAPASGFIICSDDNESAVLFIRDGHVSLIFLDDRRVADAEAAGNERGYEYILTGADSSKFQSLIEDKQAAMVNTVYNVTDNTKWTGCTYSEFSDSYSLFGVYGDLSVRVVFSEAEEGWKVYYANGMIPSDIIVPNVRYYKFFDSENIVAISDPSEFVQKEITRQELRELLTDACPNTLDVIDIDKMY
ncbi:MAG: hypothetical protein ILO42_00445 [Clostridia bacterium]|nr:hypothetical protein [Clostridia bacterium]